MQFSRDTAFRDSYRRRMDEAGHIIRLTLSVDQPVELGDFVSAFTSLGIEYDSYMKANHPDLSTDTKLYVKEVRKGSIQADLVPIVTNALAAGGLAAGAVLVLNGLNTAHEFVERYGKTLKSFTQWGTRDKSLTKSELVQIGRQMAAVAKETGSNLSIASITQKSGREETTVKYEFSSQEALAIEENSMSQKKALDQSERADYERVLIRFTQTNTNSVKPGNPTGERVVLEKLDIKPRRVIYSSDLVEAYFRRELLEERDNIYRKSFLVDVNVEFQNGKPFAYAVTSVHSKYDMDDD